MTSERAVDELAEAVTTEIVDAYKLNRGHRLSRWHEDSPSATRRESWACVPLTDAVYGVMAAAHRSALRLAATPAPREDGWEELRREIEALSAEGSPGLGALIYRAAVLAIISRLATPTTPEPDPRLRDYPDGHPGDVDRADCDCDCHIPGEDMDPADCDHCTGMSEQERAATPEPDQ